MKLHIYLNPPLLCQRGESADPKHEDKIECSRRVWLRNREQGDELVPQSLRDGHELDVLHTAQHCGQARLRVRELLLATVVINPDGRVVTRPRPCGGTRHRCGFRNAGGMGVGTNTGSMWMWV